MTWPYREKVSCQSNMLTTFQCQQYLVKKSCRLCKETSGLFGN